LKSKLANKERSFESMNKYKFIIWLEIHKIICRYWNWRLPKDLNKELKRWKKIDYRKDRSWSGRSFRFWYYIRQVDKHRFS